MKKSDIFWQTYLNLEKELIEVSKFIFITDVKIVNRDGVEIKETCKTQLATFSPHLADLLVRCCVQIEAISKELYYDNGGTKPRGDNSICFDEDCLKLIDIKWETHNKSVLVVAPFFNLTKDENLILRPLKDAHKRQGTCWEKAYQAVKHDRYASLCYGNVKALIHAMAALYLLNIYYLKESWIVPYNEIAKQDYSLGSALFAVKTPAINKLWEGNVPEISDSPFVVRYKDEDYKMIDTIRSKEHDTLNAYWQSQPELHEPAFIIQLQTAKKEGRTVVEVWELAKYRLNKQIPSSLPFEERKKRLLHSEAWNGWVNQHNKHIAPEELTEFNIQDEINAVAVRWGIEIMQKYQKLEWLPIATNSGMCRVYIPE